MIRGYAKDAPERKELCTKIVTSTVRKTASIILRELEKDNAMLHSTKEE